MTSKNQFHDNRQDSPFVNHILDFAVTLACWTWFIFGFLFFFSWAYLAAALFTRNLELAFQRLNHYFFRIFFRLVRTVAPRQKFEIDKNIGNIRSAVVICNHLSYLDPLLLVALFPRQRTIVKPRFFDTPIFGWMIKKSGYLPASSEGRFSRLMIEQMETMATYLQDGGNLFIFPEGTRSKDGKIGKLNQGALKIARMCKAPLYILQLRNTEKLFTPGKFLFNSRKENLITIRLIARITPDYCTNQPSIDQLEQQVRAALSTGQN